MIPKIIHYCWFGRGEMPKLARKCLESWKKYCSDYEIMEWNEDNFDIDSNEYIKEAYAKKKFAFVSDYVRLYALYKYGGIYMDTDVEVLNNFDSILHDQCVFGFEEANYIATSFMAAEPRNQTIKEFFDLYANESFINENGTLNTQTNVGRLTSLLTDKGLMRNNKMQRIDGAVIYPKEYFSPYDYINCVDERTENSYCIHWYYVSWMPKTERIKKLLKKTAVRVLGKQTMVSLRSKFKCGV